MVKSKMQNMIDTCMPFEISKDLYNQIRQGKTPVYAYTEDMAIELGFHPLKKIYVEAEDHIGANESDSQGSWFIEIVFSYKGKYYKFYEQG